MYSVSSVFSGGVTPDPIPNSAVKPTSADGTSHRFFDKITIEKLVRGRVGQCWKQCMQGVFLFNVIIILI